MLVMPSCPSPTPGSGTEHYFIVSATFFWRGYVYLVMVMRKVQVC